MPSLATYNFFSKLSEIDQSLVENDFMRPIADIDADTTSMLYQLCQTIELSVFTRPKENSIGNMEYKLIYSHNGSFSFDQDPCTVEWDSSTVIFKETIEKLGITPLGLRIIKMNPLGFFDNHTRIEDRYHMPTDSINAGFNIFWIPLNYVAERYFAVENRGYFEPKMGHAYCLNEGVHDYAMLNLGTEPMYNLAGVYKQHK